MEESKQKGGGYKKLLTFGVAGTIFIWVSVVICTALMGHYAPENLAWYIPYAIIIAVLITFILRPF